MPQPGTSPKRKFATYASPAQSPSLPTASSTPAPPSSRPTRPTTTRPTTTSTKSAPADKKKIMILGGGPNRIGQGIEFDYCCVHAAFALRKSATKRSWSTPIPRPSRPTTTPATNSSSSRSRWRTSSTSAISEKPDGVIVQFGGQTPLNLAAGLEGQRRANHRHLGRIDRARRGPQAFPGRCSTSSASTSRPTAPPPTRTKPSPPPPRSATPSSSAPASSSADAPCRSSTATTNCATTCATPSPPRPSAPSSSTASSTTPPKSMSTASPTARPRSSARSWSTSSRPASIRGDSACVIPAPTLSEKVKNEIREATIKMAQALDVNGLMNVQFAVKDEVVYVLEVNPRASRTVPFVSKAIGVAAGQARRENHDRHEAARTSASPRKSSPPTIRSRKPSSPSPNSAAPTFCSGPK